MNSNDSVTQQTMTSQQEVSPRELLIEFLHDFRNTWKSVKNEHQEQYNKLKTDILRCIVLLWFCVVYCAVGGLMFQFLEGTFEVRHKCGVKRVKRDFIDYLWNQTFNLGEAEWKHIARKKLIDFEDQLHVAIEAGINSYSGQKAWNLLNSMYYSLTVITTIGYGHMAPATIAGRIVTIIYAIIGIPLFLILLADFGKLFTRGIKFVWAIGKRMYYTGSCKKIRKTAPVQNIMKGVQTAYDMATLQYNPEGNEPTTATTEPETPGIQSFVVDDEFDFPVSVAIIILLAYLLIGAGIYVRWEKWNYFESFYFVFISMSTIGFGDLVPQHPMYMMGSIVYLVFGLALTSMCINIVQEKLHDTFKHASVKLSSTIGLQEASEGQPTPLPQVEVTDVHHRNEVDNVSSDDDEGPMSKNADNAKELENDMVKIVNGSKSADDMHEKVASETKNDSDN